MFKFKIKLFFITFLIIFLILNVYHIFYKNEFHESFQNSTKIRKLRENVVLPQDYSETGHCFADGTHKPVVC